MAGSKFFMLFDDLATILDDVAAMSKLATKKTAGIVGDDLALNANQVVGVSANREIPVVWKVFVGSMINKVILIPIAILISVFAPFLITPLLMIGGAFLCFEGLEKVIHKFFHKAEGEKHKQEILAAVKDQNIDLVQFEKDKIKGAVRTDFILSAEIIAIVLGVVAGKPLLTQSIVITVIAVGVTFLVYGLVAAIVKLDDFGLWLKTSANEFKQKMGDFTLWAAPKFMKTLSVVGTIAMFLVGGEIIAHGVPFIHHFVEGLSVHENIDWLLKIFINIGVGLVSGAICVGLFEFFKKIKSNLSKKS